MEDVDICDNWEQIEEDSDMFEKQFEKLKLKPRRSCSPESTSVGGTLWPNTNSQGPECGIELDSTTTESLRTQYVPVEPEPKPLQILSRAGRSTVTQSTVQHIQSPQPNGVVKIQMSAAKSSSSGKTLQQREQEYAEARMRILGDVRFLEEEREVELENTLSPAEILKLKISEAMQGEVSQVTLEELKNAQGKGSGEEGTHLEEPSPPKDFPVSKLESGHIIRQPRGPDPDGSTGFHHRK